MDRWSDVGGLIDLRGHDPRADLSWICAESGPCQPGLASRRALLAGLAWAVTGGSALSGLASAKVYETEVGEQNMSP